MKKPQVNADPNYFQPSAYRIAVKSGFRFLLKLTTTVVKRLKGYKELKL